MTANNRLAVFSLASLLVVGATPGKASVAAFASFDEKVENAAAIVVGKCIRTESRFDPTGRWIVTYSTFAVEQSLKGTAAQTVTVVTPGGSVNGIHQESVGIPSFHEGSENVLFIRDSKLGPTLLYFDQGAYDVRRDGGGEAVVAPVASDMVHIDTQRGVAVPAEAPRTLQQLRSDIERSMRERHQQMSMIPSRAQTTRATLTSIILDNKLVIGAAILGVALAAWQLWRR